MTQVLHFACESLNADGSRSSRMISVVPSRFIIAGWTGRDAAAIDHHIEELAAIGVPRPSSVPLYYRAGLNLLSQSEAVQSVGDQSSGEAEPVLFFAQGEWWLTVGSDHTDRHVEGYSVAVSKQMCPKPVATSAWRWSDVVGRQDEIGLQSRIVENDAWVDYQRGSFASIRPLESLRDGFFGAAGAEATEGCFMFCGTLGAIPNAQGQGIRAAASMEISLQDTKLGRAIVHAYTVEALPVVA